MLRNYKIYFFVFISSLSYNSLLLGQGTNDWFRDVSIINSGKPIDFSSLLNSASQNSELVCIGVINIDLTNDSTQRLDLSRKKDFLSCFPNFDLNKFRVKCYNYTGHNEVDLHIKWGEENIKKNDAGKRSSFYIITSNPNVISILDSEKYKELRKGLSLFAFDSVITGYDTVRIYSSMEIEKSRISGDFCWKLNQNFTYFSNLDLSIPKKESSDSLFRKVRINLKANIGKNARDQFSQNFQTSFGFEFIKGNSWNIFINIGLQQSSDFWSKDDFPTQSLSVLNPNQHLDELIVSSSNVRENYNSTSTSAIIGVDFKSYLGKSKAYVGIYGNLVKPVIYNLSFSNTSGEFDYVGVLNPIQDPITNIPDLGLVSGVSYVGYKSDITGKLKVFYDFGAMLGYSIGEKAPLDISFAMGLTTSKKFDLNQTNSAISSSFGEYNSIATVNNTQIFVPRFWNVGFSVRKYLN